MPEVKTRLLFLYDDTDTTTAARTGESDAPQGLLRTAQGEEIRAQFFFSTPPLSPAAVADACQRLLDYSSWVIVCPQSRLDAILHALRNLLGQELQFESASMPAEEEAHWQRLLQDNLTALTGLNRSFIFSKLRPRASGSQEEADDTRIERRKQRLLDVQRVSGVVSAGLLLVLTAWLLNDQFNLYAKITGQEVRIYYAHGRFAGEHDKTPEWQLGERLFELAGIDMRWIATENDSVLFAQARQDSSAVILSQVDRDEVRRQGLLTTRPYLRARLVLVALNRDYEAQSRNGTLDLKNLRIALAGGPFARTRFKTIAESNGLSTSFEPDAPATAFQNLPTRVCDLLIVDTTAYKQRGSLEAAWRANFRLLSGTQSIPFLSLFTAMGAPAYFAFSVFNPTNDASRILGPVGVLLQDQNEVRSVIRREWTEISIYSSLSDCIEALRQKQVAVAFLPALLYQDFARRNSVEDLITIAGAGSPSDFVLGVHPQRQDLVQKLNNALDMLDYEMSRSGIYRNVFVDIPSTSGAASLAWFPPVSVAAK